MAASSPRRTGGLKLLFGIERRSALVLIRWDRDGQRGEITVPLQEARAPREPLERQGAVVYWSERLT